MTQKTFTSKLSNLNTKASWAKVSHVPAIDGDPNLMANPPWRRRETTNKNPGASASTAQIGRRCPHRVGGCSARWWCRSEVVCEASRHGTAARRSGVRDPSPRRHRSARQGRWHQIGRRKGQEIRCRDHLQCRLAIRRKTCMVSVRFCAGALPTYRSVRT